MLTPRVGKIFHGGIDDPKAWTHAVNAVGGFKTVEPAPRK